MKHSKSQKAFSLIELSIVIVVIGILIAGVIQGSNLLSKMRIASATNLTKNSPVSSIRNLMFWYEATMEESFDSSIDLSDSTDETIAIWKDINSQMQHKTNMTQDTDDNKPFLEKRSLNGLPAVSFRGDDFLSNSNISYLIQGNSVLSFFMIFNTDHTAAAAKSFFL